MRRFAIAIGVLATLMETSVHAADIPVKVPQPLPQAAWNWSGFYVGVGGSLNWADFNQSLQGVSGVTNVMLGPLLVAQGQAGGPFFDFNRHRFGVAPDIQLGYIAAVGDGAWLAGIKFTYKYANNNSKQNVITSADGVLHHGGRIDRQLRRLRASPSGGVQSTASTCAHSHHWPRV